MNTSTDYSAPLESAKTYATLPLTERKTVYYLIRLAGYETPADVKAADGKFNPLLVTAVMDTLSLRFRREARRLIESYAEW